MEIMVEKFKGTMVGVLIGDSLGAPFESGFVFTLQAAETKSFLDAVLNESLPENKLVGRNYLWSSKEGKTSKKYLYTDDTAMTLSLATSLLENKEYVPEDVAKRFTEGYFKDKDRKGEYGRNVITVFEKLQSSEYSDVYQPAREQFGGKGSYGNGAAMRVTPVALFYRNDLNMLKKVAELQGKITHGHRYGYEGAILQALAVQKALISDSKTPLNTVKFVDELLAEMSILQTPATTDEKQPYTEKLEVVKSLLLGSSDPSPDEIARILGNSISAHGSVPTAIYCFLRAENPITDVQYDSPVVRAIYFAVSCDGDTDTIASMAAGISGARHGIGAIPEVLLKRCGGTEEMMQIAEKLHDVSK